MNTVVATPSRRAQACAFFGVEEHEAPLPEFELLKDGPADISKLLKPGFVYAERLLSLASGLPFLSLQSIHLCQAITHTFVILAKIIPPNKDITPEDLEDCIALDRIALALKGLFTVIQQYSGDDEHAPRSQWQQQAEDIFIRLCRQTHGTDDIIRSKAMFLELKGLDENIESVQRRRRTGEMANTLNEEGFDRSQGIQYQDAIDEPRDINSIQDSITSNTDKDTLPAPPSQDGTLKAPLPYPPTFFLPLLDALNKVHQKIIASNNQAQSVQYSVVEQELPPAAHVGFTFGEYVAAAARAGVIVIGGSGDGTWIALREWTYSGRSVGSEGPL